MSDEEQSAQMAEVLRLALLEGLSVRAIARRLSMSRKTVRRMLGRKLACNRKPPSQPRPSSLDPYKDEIRQMLADTPELRSPAILERLRAKGYTGGYHDFARPRPHAPDRAHRRRRFSPWTSNPARRFRSIGPTSASHFRGVRDASPASLPC